MPTMRVLVPRCAAAGAALLLLASCMSSPALPPLPARLAIAVNRIDGLGRDFMKGVDVSMLAQIEAAGGVFHREDGTAADALAILREHGVTWVRLRLWNNPVFPVGTKDFHGNPAQPGPVGGGNDDETVVRGLAKRAHALGLKVDLDFHYSDFWADTGTQDTPAAWAGLDGPALEKAVHDYTRAVITDMKADGVAPDMVEIGNEVNNGMLWPLGKVTGDKSKTESYAGFIRLLKAASRGVREASPSTRIMIHIAEGGNTRGALDFFGAVDPGVDYDVIGLSYYPYWHGTIAELQTTMDVLAARFSKPVVVAEMAYAFTSDNGDSQPNSWSGGDPSGAGFAVSVQGQATAMRSIMEAVSRVPDNRGLGVFYWEPDWIPVPGAGWITGQGDSWDNQAWWDFHGMPLESMWTYRLVSESTTTAAAVVSSAPSIAVDTTVGAALRLPATVAALFSDGSWRQVRVTWEAVDPAQTSTVGSFTANGTVEGGIALTATVKVAAQDFALNGGFESGAMAPWVSTASSAGASVSAFSVEKSSPTGNTHTGLYTGSYWYGSPYTFDAHESIAGLAPGSYTVTAWVMGDGKPKSLRLYADTGSRATTDVVNTGWQKWRMYTLAGVVVGQDGKLVVGLEGDMSGGDWGKLDDVVVNRD